MKGIMRICLSSTQPISSGLSSSNSGLWLHSSKRCCPGFHADAERYPLDNCKPTAKYGTLGLFRANQIPEITPIIIEKQGLNVACGAIGIGEITSIPTAPAIAGAYYKWNGQFQTALPLEGTPYAKKKA